MSVGVDFLADEYGKSGCFVFHRNFLHWISRMDVPEKYYIFVYDGEYKQYKQFIHPYSDSVKLISLGRNRASLPLRLFDQHVRVPFLMKKLGVDRGFSDNILPICSPPEVRWTFRVLITQQFHSESDDKLLRKSYRSWTSRYACRRAKMVVPNSRHTLKEIQKYCAVPDNKVKLIGEAVDHEIYYPLTDKAQVQESVKQMFGLHRPYLMQVSGYYDHKNPQLSIRALKWLHDRQMDLDLVLVGADPRGNRQRYETLARELGVGDYVKFLQFQVPNNLRLLYNKCLCLLYPSTSETFGIPPLEAMACGIPVVASNQSSVPEVVGGAGVIVDPYDLEAFGAAIMAVVKKPAWHSELVARGLRHAKGYRWEEIIAQLHDTIIAA
jgi:glycosyltransferase involved in cell wall biosynthesis